MIVAPIPPINAPNNIFVGVILINKPIPKGAVNPKGVKNPANKNKINNKWWKKRALKMKLHLSV